MHPTARGSGRPPRIPMSRDGGAGRRWNSGCPREPGAHVTPGVPRQPTHGAGRQTLRYRQPSITGTPCQSPGGELTTRGHSQPGDSHTTAQPRTGTRPFYTTPTHNHASPTAALPLPHTSEHNHRPTYSILHAHPPTHSCTLASATPPHNCTPTQPHACTHAQPYIHPSMTAHPHAAAHPPQPSPVYTRTQHPYTCPP